MTSVAAAQAPATHVDWPAFMARHDLVWDRLPTRWGESAFVGNGRLGATIDLEAGAFGWTIDRTDLVHDQSRWPVGRVLLKTAGAVTGGAQRLALWDAEASGTVVTDRGEVRWRTFVATAPSAIVVVLDGRGGERAPDLAWAPAEARPPRKVARKEAFAPEDLHPPAAVTTGAGGITSVQTFLNGGAHAESIRRGATRGSTRVFYVSIGLGDTGPAARAAARAATDSAAARGLAALTASSRAWWHAYYPASLVSFPDPRLESYYWVNVYKLGASMREDGPILDLAGPWYRDTPWPAIWWNLNTQLTYSPLFRANRVGLSESLFRHLDRNRKALEENVPARLRGQAAAIGRSSGPDLVRKVDLATATSDAAHEMGNLPWVMFLYWQRYRYTMDDRVLRDRVYPLLRLAVGNYLAYVEKGADGRWHLPKTHSPELATVPDATYDLSLLRWGLETLIASAGRLHVDDPLLPRWRDVLANLTPFPQDSTGLWVGRDRPWKESHRHYSHLLGVYPLGLLRPDRPDERALVETSLRTWERDPSAFRGYSFTGGAAMHAWLGDGDAALERLDRYLDAPRYMEPNTFYAEAGPVIETPYSALTSMQELFLQDWGGAMRVFPAVPSAWRDAAFDRLRADGAFLVSGVRKDGRTAWVRVESLAGSPCRLVVPGWSTFAIRAHGGGTARVSVDGKGGELRCELSKGAWMVLAPDAASPLPPLAPVARPAAARNPWPALPRDTARAAPPGPQDAPDMAWWRRSMQTRDERLAWWREARFGMFIHWGAYSRLGGVWNGEPVKGYAEHIQRIRKIPAAVYRDSAVARFDPVRFDADAWVRTAKQAGMGYMIITAKHHDGFAMYDSKVSEYNVVKASPWHRDPMRELRDAARRHGVRFGFYYSHAFDWGDPEAPGNDWEHDNPGGDKLLHGGRDWWVQSPQLVAQVRRYVDRKAIPQVRELIQRYDPDIMWFDTPHKLPPEENLRILRAAREAKPGLVINSRVVQPVPGGPAGSFGDYVDTADRPAELTHPAGDWEAIPTTNESYGWHMADSTHKPPEHFVRLLAKAAARGGNLLLNVGPMGDGRIDPRDTTILAAIGRWMATNGASIRGTTRTPLPVQPWGESTRRGSRLYLHVLDWPRDGRLRVSGLRSDVARASLLARPGAPLAVRRAGPSDVEVAVPAEPPDPWDAVVVLDCGVPIETDSARPLTRAAETRLHVFDGELAGAGVAYSDGKRDNDVAIGWSRAGGGVAWPVRVEERGRYRVSLEYAKASADTGAGGALDVAVGEARLAARPEPTGAGSRFEVREVGSLALEPGRYTLRVRATADGASALRLRRVILTPSSE